SFEPHAISRIRENREPEGGRSNDPLWFYPERSLGFPVTVGSRVSAPAEIVPVVRQIADALAGNLEYRVANRRLDRGGAVVPQPDPPNTGGEEANVDLGRVLLDARQRERVEIVLDDAPVLDRARLVH